MPILASQTTVYPENLLDGLTAPDTNERCWWALYTKARQEKALARQLEQFGIPFYLPLIPRDNLIRGRKVKSYIPLFTGYIFLYGDDTERVLSLTTNRISRILDVVDQVELGRDLGQIRQLIDSNAPLSIERRLTPGQRVRIKGGPMAGLEGAVIERRAKTRLLVTVKMLQQGVSVEIDDYILEPIG